MRSHLLKYIAILLPLLMISATCIKVNERDTDPFEWYDLSFNTREILSMHWNDTGITGMEHNLSFEVPPNITSIRIELQWRSYIIERKMDSYPREFRSVVEVFPPVQELSETIQNITWRPESSIDGEDVLLIGVDNPVPFNRTIFAMDSDHAKQRPLGSYSGVGNWTII